MQAIDFNPVAIERARSVAQALGVSVAFNVADLFLHEIPPVDVVVSVGVLHHTDDCQAAVRRVCQAFVKPGGRMVYVTCSLFAEENEDRLKAFLARRPDFALAQPGTRMTPLEAGTDGFFVAALTRSSEPK